MFLFTKLPAWIFVVIIITIGVIGLISWRGILIFEDIRQISNDIVELSRAIHKTEKAPDETIDWKTYRNEEYGFEVKYPEDYLIKEEKIIHGLEEEQPPEYIQGYIYDKPVRLLYTTEIYSPSSPSKEPKIGIDVWNNASNFPVNQWVDYVNEGVEQGLLYEGRFVGNRESFSVMRIEAIKGTYGCCGRCIKGIFIPKKDKIYNLKLDGRDGCNFVDEPIFNQILSTFKFIEPTCKNNVFKLETAKVGDEVACMTIKSIDKANKSSNIPLSINNAAIEFSGETTITGTYIYYGDYTDYEDMLYPFNTVCFTIDASSLKNIPQEQQQICGSPSSFCFSNQDLAKSKFGPKLSSERATVIIDNYILKCFPSEGYNTAKLVRVISE